MLIGSPDRHSTPCGGDVTSEISGNGSWGCRYQGLYPKNQHGPHTGVYSHRRVLDHISKNVLFVAFASQETETMTAFTEEQRRLRVLEWLQIIYKDVEDVIV